MGREGKGNHPSVSDRFSNPNPFVSTDGQTGCLRLRVCLSYLGSGVEDVNSSSRSVQLDSVLHPSHLLRTMETRIKPWTIPETRAGTTHRGRLAVVPTPTLLPSRLDGRPVSCHPSTVHGEEVGFPCVRLLRCGPWPHRFPDLGPKSTGDPALRTISGSL